MGEDTIKEKQMPLRGWRTTDKAFWTRSRQDSLRDVSEAML
jgi:hypothetical protein